MSRVPNNALVVVADGGKALFLRAKAGPAAAGHDTAVTTLHELEKLMPGDIPLQGPSGSRPEEQSVKQTSEASFANHVAKHLEAMARAGNAADIVLVADPHTLGELRAALHKSVSDKVAFTLDKDLTKHSLPDIAKALH